MVEHGNEQYSRVIPVLLAAIVCDTACRDPNLQKVSLIGIFDRLIVVQFPTSRAVSVYLKVTDAIGKYHFDVKFVQVNSGKTLAGAKGEIDIKDKLSSHEILIAFPPLRVNSSGRYEFQIWMNDTFLGSTFIDAETQEEAMRRPRG